MSAQELTFSTERGFHNTPFSLSISTDLPSATIIYTADYTRPDFSNGQVYTSPLNISQTTTIRAFAYNTTDTVRATAHTYTFLADIIAQDTMQTSITQDPVWAPQIENSFLSIPSVFISRDSLLIDTPRQAISAEFIFHDTNDHFQINCGGKIFGNGGYHTDRMSVRLYFDQEWDGPKNLNYPLFEGYEEGIQPVEKFDKLDLRFGWYDTWANGLYQSRYDDHERIAYISTKMADDLLLHMGNLSPHTRPVHIFQNGVYQGIATMRERFDDNMVAEYHEEDNDDYEYLSTPDQRVSVFHPFSPVLQHGSGVQWADLVARSQVSYSSWTELIDEDNFFDRMIIFIYGQGEAEYRAIGAPQIGREFILNQNDADFFFYNGNVFNSDRTNPLHNFNGPDNMFVNLYNSGDKDFRMDFADRIHKQLTGDGPLTHSRVSAHLQKVADMYDPAMIAESARWSSYPEANRDVWRRTVDSIAEFYTNNRPAVVLEDLKKNRLYPTIDAVQYSLPEGQIAFGSQLTLNNPNNTGSVFYTINGNDPRASGGSINTGVAVYSNPVNLPYPVNVVQARVLGSDTTYNYTNHAIGKPSVLSSNISSTDYQAYNANDGNLFSTLRDRNMTRPLNEPQPWWEVDLQSQDTIHQIKVWYTSELGSYYLNKNVHVFASDQPFPDVDAATLKADPNVESFYVDGISGDLIEFDLPQDYVGRYVRVMMNDTTQTLWLAEVEVIQYDYANPVVEPVWSAMEPITYYLPQNYNDLVINEIHYNPTDSIIVNDTIDGDEYEFIEIKNTGSNVVHLTGVTLLNGINYEFPFGSSIAPGGFYVIAEDSLHFVERYGFSADGKFSGKLKNGGESVLLNDPFGNIIDEVNYDDLSPWIVSPDGTGPSLALLPNENDNSLSSAWAEQNVRYTPGAENDFCAAIFSNSFASDVNCNGGNDGSIVFLPAGGNTPYTYSWSNGMTSQSISGLAAGSYSVTLTDSYNCPYTESFVVNQPTNVNPAANWTDETVAGANDGIINLSVSGGTAPYTYLWSNGATTANLNGLSPGVYSCTVTDANGCTASEQVTIQAGTIPCTAPSGITTVNIQNTSATVTWNTDPVVNSYEIEYREAGTSVWSTFSSSISFAILTNLSDCTSYELRVKANCANASGSAYSNIFSFQTIGCNNVCGSLVGLYSHNITNSSAILAWDAIPYANYTMYYREVGAASWFDYTTPYPLAILFNLPECADFEWYVVVNCPNGAVSSPSTIANFVTLGTPCGVREEGELISEESKLLIYPNPTSEVLYLDLNIITDKNLKLELTDMNGKIIYKEEVEPYLINYPLSFSNLSTGVYSLRVFNEDYQYIEKVIKQ